MRPSIRNLSWISAGIPIKLGMKCGDCFLCDLHRVRSVVANPPPSPKHNPDCSSMRPKHIRDYLLTLARAAILFYCLPLSGCGQLNSSAPDASTSVSIAKPSDSMDKIDRSRGACVFFLGTDCPISNAYAPEIARIVQQYSSQGIHFYAVYAVRDISQSDAEAHAEKYGLSVPVISDGELKLAQQLAATRMPEVVLLPTEGTAVYQGRIDDRYPQAGGKRREHPTKYDLRDALDAFVAGEPIDVPRTEAVGCHLDLP
jgi:Redoxin